MTKRKISAKCVDLDDFGRGIIKFEGHAYFIDDFLPDEEAIIETIYEYGKIVDAYIIKRLKDSPYRVKPICKYYPDCGGCQLMHLAYPQQLLYKSKKVKYLLHKFAHLDVDVLPTIGLDNPTRFRNKVQKPIGMDYKNNVPVAGFYRNGTHELIPVDDCLMETELSSKITDKVLDLMVKYDYYPFDEDEMTGLVRHLLIKTSSFYNTALVTLVVTDPEVKSAKDFAKDLMDAIPEVKGVVFNLNYRHTNVILGEKNIPILGETHIADKIFDKEFLISTKSFYQTNPKQIETLYGTAIKLAGLKKTDTVLDAYCGTGTIGLSLADKVKKVVGVEIEPEAIEDANKNAQLNKIANATLIEGDCTEYLNDTKENFDVIIMDPPRKGSTPDFLNAVKRIKPRTLVYISCDPVTLSRDIGLISDTYEIKTVQPVDMFPNTMHVETVVSLSQRKSDEKIKVEVDGDALPVTKAESKATYEDIQKYIFDKYGLKVTSLDISRVKTKCGIKERKNYNLSKSNNYKQPGITDEKEEQILDALRLFKMV